LANIAQIFSIRSEQLLNGNSGLLFILTPNNTDLTLDL